MSKDISEDLKKILFAGIGAAALTAEKASELVRYLVQKGGLTAEKSSELVSLLVKKGELTVEQGKVLNEELRQKFREKIKETAAPAGPSIADQLEKMSAEELSALKARIAELEKASQDGKDA